MTFFDVSTAAELEPLGTVLIELARHTEACDVDFMVVGAAARDILIKHGTGATPDRATADVDIAIAVASWQDFTCITQRLGGERGAAHRFVVLGVEVDIIPFGGVESAERTVDWPDDHVMDVLGFSEAYRSAIKAALPGGLVVSVASLEAQSLLKLFAWRDRRHQDTRDAIDLRSLLRVASEGRYLEGLYTDHEMILAKNDFDPVLAGAERIGRDAGRLLAAGDREAVTSILDSSDLLHALAADMRGSPGANTDLLGAYRSGFAMQG